MNRTEINYLTHTWNPIAMKCTRVSPACDNCWHLRMANRLAHNPKIAPGIRAGYAGEGPVLIESRLDDPAKRKKPAIIGTQFMGDLFHRSVPDGCRQQIFKVMAEARHHTFLVLTKRPHAMRMFFTNNTNINGMLHLRHDDWAKLPIPNIWLGVTVENQATADERIPLLLQTPAAVRFVSAEPLLGAVDLSAYLPTPYQLGYKEKVIDEGKTVGVDWVGTGGETGPGARPSHPDDFRSLRDQCQAAGVNFFFKSYGEWMAWGTYDFPTELSSKYNGDTIGRRFKSTVLSPYVMYRIGNKRVGHLLNGRAWRQMPRHEGEREQ